MPAAVKKFEVKNTQAHVYEVPKHPLSLTHAECIKRVQANMPPPPPVTTKEWEGGSHLRGADPNNGHEISKTIINVTLRILKTGETMTVPAWTGSTAGDMAATLEGKFGLPENSVRFIRKQGVYNKPLYHSDQIAPTMLVKGIDSFQRPRHKPEHPYTIIGAGHIGVRSGLVFLEKKETNFVIIDRMKEVGGTAWWTQANSTSKLQTEYGVYHIDWAMDSSIPQEFKTPWPTRDDLLKMFIDTTDRTGLRAHCRLSTEVKKMEVVKRPANSSEPRCVVNSSYVLTLATTDGDPTRPIDDWTKGAGSKSQDEEFKTRGILFFPGNLTLPRRETYKGEEDFDGQIEYAMFGNADYEAVKDQNVCVVGHGAFAVENVRTCVEFSCKQIYLVCRRKNIACPRVPSWFANRSLNPVAGSLFLRSMQPMYDFMGWSVFDYYAVQGTPSSTVVNINQKARFGLSDIYFLVGYYGKMEVILDDIKRCSHHQVMLGSGRKLDCSVILKNLGFIGEAHNDKLMQIKELVGYWVNEDPLRYIVAEPVSVQAQNFGGTSLSPGAYMWAHTGVHFILFPGDLQPLLDAKALPRHASDDSDEGSYRPAYVIDARHGNATGISTGMMCPAMAQEGANNLILKPIKQRLCHPIRQYTEEAKADWDFYCKQLIQEGYDKPYPHYPYTADVARTIVLMHMRDSQEPPIPSDFEDLEIPEDCVGSDGRILYDELLKTERYRDIVSKFEVKK